MVARKLFSVVIAWTVLLTLVDETTSRTLPILCDSNRARGYWNCSDKYCIEAYYVCDGVVDCLNGRDEFKCVVCRGDSFHCDNKRCISMQSYCNGINECGDGSDEPDSCPKTGYPDLIPSDINNIVSADVIPSSVTKTVKSFYGILFGSVAGIILLLIGILLLVVVVVVVCVCNKNCPVYKWRNRRHYPPVGVIVADTNMEHKSDEEESENENDAPEKLLSICSESPLL